MITSARWRTPVRHARSLTDVLAFLRALDPAARLVVPPGAGPVDAPAVDGITLDSTQVVAGDLFAGLPGTRRHGAEYADQAARAGAVAVLSDRACTALPTVVVAAPRRVLGPLASWLHGTPSAALDVHGVTGTNGKTSTVHLLAAGLRAAGRRVARAGSLEVRVGDRARAAERTTAEAPAVQEFLASARDAGAGHVALEVSSHGLALDRVAGTRFRSAVFTNLSPDHLDLHGDLEGYYASKASLFTPERCGLAVVGVDDEAGRRLARETRCPVVTFAAGGRPADWRALDVHAGITGTRFRLCGPGIDRQVRLRLLGAHQVDNVLAAVATLAATGVDLHEALRGIEEVGVLPGRLERVDVGQPFLALVDFAHNVGGQRRLLPFLRSLTDGRLIVVLGATGERDPAKRADLGACVGAQADVAVVTDESAHSDDPAALRAAVADAARGVGRADVVVEADRARAIALAVATAAPGDVVLVAGRGADRVQVSAGGRRDFDDRLALRHVLLEQAAPAWDAPVAG
jgi:UDP-N-acetylmuramoyl-L-alanyl-D-glutamate--2,6-diaminopimelate ligase